MGRDEKELSDVVVILIDEPGVSIHEAANRLRELGLGGCEVNEDEGVVEGTIEIEKLGAIKKLEFVKYVRDVFTYDAEKPAGDDEDDLKEEADDAGA